MFAAILRALKKFFHRPRREQHTPNSHYSYIYSSLGRYGKFLKHGHLIILNCDLTDLEHALFKDCRLKVTRSALVAISVESV